MIFPDRVLGRSAANRMSSGRAIAPIFLTTCSLSSATSAGDRGIAFLEDDERRNRLTLQIVRAADNRRFGDPWMIHQRALHFHRADPVPGDVDHIVDAAEHPEIPVLIALRAVAGEIRAAIPLAPVLRHEALGIAVDAAQHRGPRPA